MIEDSTTTKKTKTTADAKNADAKSASAGDTKAGNAKAKKLLAALPSVSALLDHEEVIAWLGALPRTIVVTALRSALAEQRTAILDGSHTGTLQVEELLQRAEEVLMELTTPSLRHVINATGIVLHTGLGRAPLGDAVAEALAETTAGYCNLEYNLDTGERGRRGDHVAELLTSLTGAEAALVVNNNAAATLLILHTLAKGREVIVSRGQLVEIGGSFRLPDIMSAGNVTLREVGTTNRTRISDYETAINDSTALLLRVHPSNYQVVGFTEEVDIGEMASVAHRYGLYAVDDLGSGVLFDMTSIGLPAEPNAKASVTAGADPASRGEPASRADLACFSGDKLLGGPQCGIIVGKKELIDRIAADPLMRTYRVGKLTLVALETTLRCYLDLDTAVESIPTLAMLATSTDQLAARAKNLCDALQHALPNEQFLVCSDVGYAGGGSLPQQAMPTVVVQWRPAGASAEQMATALRRGDTPVIVRVREDAITFDLRTVQESEMESLVESVEAAVWDSAPEDDGQNGGNGLSLPVLS